MKLPREFLKNGGDVLSGRTNVTTQLGSSVVLPCVVKQVGSNTVRTTFLNTITILKFFSKLFLLTKTHFHFTFEEVTTDK